MKKAILLFMIFMFCSKLVAHEQHTHQYITNQAYYLLKKCLSADLPVMLTYLDNGPVGPAWTNATINAGALREDEEDVIYGYSKTNPPTVTGIEAAPPSSWVSVGSNSPTFVMTAPKNGDYRDFKLRCIVTDAVSTTKTSNEHYVYVHNTPPPQSFIMAQSNIETEKSLSKKTDISNKAEVESIGQQFEINKTKFPLVEAAQYDSLFDSQLVKDFLFLEAGGNGIFASINYERLLTKEVGIRIGAGSLGYAGLSFPIMVNYYFFEKHKLELGIGIIPFSKLEKNDFVGEEGTLLSFTLGLKSYMNTGGLMFRVSLTPFLNLTKGNMNLFGGLSCGWALN